MHDIQTEVDRRVSIMHGGKHVFQTKSYDSFTISSFLNNNPVSRHKSLPKPCLKTFSAKMIKSKYFK